MRPVTPTDMDVDERTGELFSSTNVNLDMKTAETLSRGRGIERQHYIPAAKKRKIN